MILKKMCRVNPYSENSRPSLYQGMASAGPPFSAAASFDISPSLYYQLYLYHLSEVLHFFFYTMSIAGRGALHTYVSTEPMTVQRQELKYQEGSVPSPDELIILSCFLGSTLGGYPALTPQSFITKSNSDPLTDEISLLKILIETAPPIYARFFQRFMTMPIKNTVELEDLIEDCFSLNIISPSNPSNTIRTIIEEHLTRDSVTSNVNLREYFTLALNRNKEFIDFLASNAPMRPRIMKEINSATPNSKARAMLTRFDSTVTIINLAIEDHGVQIFTRLWRAETQMITYLTLRFCQPLMDIWECSLELARYLRAFSWQRDDITGVDYPAVHELMVLERLKRGVCSLCAAGDRDFISFFPDAPMTRWMALTILGLIFPYLGSYTKEKNDVSLKYTKTAEVPSNMKSLSEILKLITWCVDNDSELAAAIKDLFRKQSDIDPDLIISKLGVGMGNIDHRFHTQEGLMGGFTNANVTALTHFSIDTNTAQSFSKGGDDFNIYFQSIFCTMLGVILSRLPSTEPEMHTYHAHFKCQKCIVQLPQDSFVTTRVYDNTWTPDMSHNPYSYIRQSAVQVKSNPIILLPYKTPSSPISEFSLLEGCMTRAGIDLAREIRDLNHASVNVINRPRSAGFYSTLLKCNVVVVLIGVCYQLIGWAVLRLLRWSPHAPVLTRKQVLEETLRVLYFQGKDTGLVIDKLYIHKTLRDELYKWKLVIDPPQNIPASNNEITNCLNSCIETLLIDLFKYQTSHLYNSFHHLVDSPHTPH